MGFDNECIINIESLAGEYFCPVCRTLVYPNEAIQSQCTHLYCKPCLTYVVGTTRACPYDGYLVTEADSKPLVESNKALAETIGNIAVRCLYHRSGCSFQRTLSDCTSHCPGCSFGNSPVVCNRCGLQIVHRQVQEHAQTCSGANSQQQPGTESLLDGANAGSASGNDRSQTTSQPVAAPPSSQVQSTPAVTAAPPTIATGQVAKQQTNLNPPVQTGAPNADQWYQQPYQQNYAQYPGYDHYQQYYPYQRPPAQQFPSAQQFPPAQQYLPAQQQYIQPQSQQQQPNRPQVQSQLQVPPPQQAQVPQPHMPPPGNLPPPPGPPPPVYTQQQMQANQYQQPQTRPPSQPAYQNAPPHHQNHPQPYPYYPSGQQMAAHPTTGQSQMHPPTMQNQPHPPHMTMPSNQQESSLAASQGQIPNIPPHQPAQQPGYGVHARPVIQQNQQPPPQQYMQQQPPFQNQQPHQYPVQSHMVPPGGPSNPVHQMPPQQVNYGGRPAVQNQVQQPHSYGAAPARPLNLGLTQPLGQHNYGNRANNMPQASSEQQFGVQSGLSATPPGVERQKAGESAEPFDSRKGLNTKSEGENDSRKIETPDKDKVSGSEMPNSLPGANLAENAKDTGKVALEKVENPVGSSLGDNVKNPQNGSVAGQLSDQGRHNYPTMPDAQLPQYPSNNSRPQGPGNFPQSGQFGPPHNQYNQGGFPRNYVAPDDHFRPHDHIIEGQKPQNNFDRKSSGFDSNTNRSNRRPDQGEFEPEIKRFSRASHERSPKFGNNPQHGGSPNFGAPSHFMPPYHPNGGERYPPVGFNENNRGRVEPYGFDRNHMEASRTPGGEYFGPQRGFDGQDMRGPPQNFPNHIPHNMPSQPRFGEPGFRSSYPHQVPNDGRFYAGETNSFDNTRRKQFTLGWCRICRIDCETIEGLDMHTQTSEHQKVAMDMVINIKRQNTKKRNDNSSFDEGRKQRDSGFNSHGAKP